MNCLVHNPYIWLKYCFSLWIELWNLKTRVVHPYHFLIHNGGKAYTDIPVHKGQRICVCLWQLELLVCYKLNPAGQMSSLNWFQGRTIFHTVFWALAVACAFSWEIAHVCNGDFFLYCFLPEFWRTSDFLQSYRQDKGLRLLFGMLIIQQ